MEKIEEICFLDSYHRLTDNDNISAIEAYFIGYYSHLTVKNKISTCNNY